MKMKLLMSFHVSIHIPLVELTLTAFKACSALSNSTNANPLILVKSLNFGRET